jgi:hypothetical protein
MTGEELVYDILEIKNLVEDDSDTDELWLLNKINMYRSLFIRQEYELTRAINPAWLQRMHKTTVTKVNSSDDPDIDFTSIDNLGKVIIPVLVALPEDIGLNRVTGSAGISQFQPIDFNTLILKIECNEERMGDYGYCARVGNALYLFPFVMEMQALLIPEDPFAIQVNDGGTLRDRTITDDYPVSMDMAQKIVMEILTKDMKINEQSIADIVNDSQSELKILQSGNSGQQQTAQV